MLSEDNALNPARNEDWKATLLVQLGTRAASVDQVIQKVMDGRPENQFLESVLREYWPSFGRLSEGARKLFQSATWLMFNLAMAEYVRDPAAMAAGKALELQLKAVVFDPFAEWARRSQRIVGAVSSAKKEDRLAKFVDGNSRLTLGAMVGSLVRKSKSAVSQDLLAWLGDNRKKLFTRLTNRELNDRVIGFRNSATHSSISAADIMDHYRDCRSWLEALSEDQ